jgi:hypothetical protein
LEAAWPSENERSAAIRGIAVTAHEEMAKKLEQEMLGNGFDQSGTLIEMRGKEGPRKRAALFLC